MILKEWCSFNITGSNQFGNLATLLHLLSCFSLPEESEFSRSVLVKKNYTHTLKTSIYSISYCIPLLVVQTWQKEELPGLNINTHTFEPTLINTPTNHSMSLRIRSRVRRLKFVQKLLCRLRQAQILGGLNGARQSGVAVGTNDMIKHIMNVVIS